MVFCQSVITILFQSWDSYFRNEPLAAPGQAYTSPPTLRTPPAGTAVQGVAAAPSALATSPDIQQTVVDHLSVQSIIRSYQVRKSFSFILF